MRSTAATFAPLLLPAALIVLMGAPVGAARAFDATMFYASPDPQTIPPLAIERKKLADQPPSGHSAAGARSGPPIGRICFTHEEARDRIAALGLSEPYRALQLGQQQGESLRAKLCRWKPDEFVYEIAVLRRDGRIVHVYMNAQNGQGIEP